MRIQERYGLSGSIVIFGVQDVMLSHEEVENVFAEANFRFRPIEKNARRFSASKLQAILEDMFKLKDPIHVHDLFTMMNFREVTTLDAFDTENPTIVHDLNKPIPDAYHGKYDVVLDIGVMEHVFDVKQFVRNCIYLLRHEGVLMLFVPLFGWHNECFYNFQPPFFFDVFSANGFDNISLYLNYFPKYYDFGKRKTTWLRFEYGDRVKFQRNNHFTMCLFVARKSRVLPEFVSPLQQSYKEYHDDWKAERTKQAAGDSLSTKSPPSHWIIENMPMAVRRMLFVLAPIYRALPPSLRVPIVDKLVHLKNRSKLAGREKIRC